MTTRRDESVPDDQSLREPEPFLSRWSRRKEEARGEPRDPLPQKAEDAQAPAPELPPLDKLTFESDYRGFLHPKVSEDMRRTALKKLFTDPHFNVMDGLDVYIDDYSKSEPIPAAMLAGLKQAQRILEWAKEDEEKRAGETAQGLRDASADRALEPPAATASSAESVPDRADTVPPASEDTGRQTGS